MLVAYGPEGRPLVAEEIPLAQLQRWSQERVLYCPNCRGLVHVRGGPDKRTQLHFAHQKGECAWSTESESVRHARGKLVIAQWLRAQFPQARVSLEERLPAPNRIADILMTQPHGQHFAFEFQCAPLDLNEWQHRHNAYQQAKIQDIWIVGNNRREKQEAFIETIIATAHEVMFLDPLVTPARIWLRWLTSRETLREWQNENMEALSLEGRIGHVGYAASLVGHLPEVQFDSKSSFIHPVRSMLENRAQLLQSLRNDQQVDEETLAAYLRPVIGDEVVKSVLIPLVRAYLRDPDLLRRYNFGRGQVHTSLSIADKHRLDQARLWLSRLRQQGFPPSILKDVAQKIPFLSVYAAFSSYVEMLAEI